MINKVTYLVLLIGASVATLILLGIISSGFIGYLVSMAKRTTEERSPTEVQVQK